MFNAIQVATRSGKLILPEGRKLKAAMYAHAYGSSLKIIYTKYGISKRRLKKALNKCA